MAGLVLRLMEWFRSGLRPYQPERHYMRGGRQKA
jgi:hypothetical protein